MAYDRVYLAENVYDAALDRIRWVFDTFKHVVVSFSGGKDSTCVLNLALQVAEERNRLPLTVMFIDQEAEWQATVDYVKEVMYDPRVRPAWLQVPFRIFNATSPTDEWLNTWDPEKPNEWIHPQDPISVKRNVYGTDRFKPLFAAWCNYHYSTRPVASLAGIRCEESPGRTLALTTRRVGKEYPVTWGWTQNAKKKHFVFSPLYDWGYRDIWKAIHDNGWSYNKVYDYQYQYGLPVREMRVSNLHHEQAVRTLYYLQEIEAETWERVTRRLAGVNTAGQMRMGYYAPSKLPEMFESWREYRDYLLENLIPEEHQVYFGKQFSKMDRIYDGSTPQLLDSMYGTQISAILKNDRFGACMSNWIATNRPPKKKAEWLDKQTAHAEALLQQQELDEIVAPDKAAVAEAAALADESAPF